MYEDTDSDNVRQKWKHYRHGKWTQPIFQGHDFALKVKDNPGVFLKTLWFPSGPKIVFKMQKMLFFESFATNVLPECYN